VIRFPNLSVLGIFVLAAISCRRESEPANAASDAPTPKPQDVLIFPSELHVTDSSVNDFVTKAMNTCAAGEYEAFRLLWSVREDPLPREEFEQGWQAVQSIKVQALEKVMLAADPNAGRAQPETVYALLAEVSLDPEQKAGQKEPQRHVVLMLTRENDAWRLARAPKPMRDWVKDKIESASEKSAAPTIPRTSGD